MTDQTERIIVTVITSISTILTAYCVAKVNKVHTEINSRMTQLLKITAESRFKDGELARQELIDSQHTPGDVK